jgi:glutamate-1-semialdehyde 2,1-aminomutase
MKFENSRSIQRRFRDAIPGGCHTYAKGDDQYPQSMPVYIARGEGCHVWDVDGNEYIEYGMGLRTVTLGHAFPPVVEAAHRQMLLGNNYVRPARIELECAEEFLSIIDGAEMVKFCKDGSDATTGAVKLARAHTGRDMVAICGDQPFFSVDDWFIGSTPMSAGIPECARALTVKFHYNDIASVKELFTRHPRQIACVVLEAEKIEPPANGFLHEVLRIAHENGALFILDEMITGFRWHLGSGREARIHGAWRPGSCQGTGVPPVHNPRCRESRPGRSAGDHGLLQGTSGYRNPLCPGEETRRRCQSGLGPARIERARRDHRPGLLLRLYDPRSG